jgi:hypothetical protein
MIINKYDDWRSSLRWTVTAFGLGRVCLYLLKVASTSAFANSSSMVNKVIADLGS